MKKVGLLIISISILFLTSEAVAQWGKKVKISGSLGAGQTKITGSCEKGSHVSIKAYPRIGGTDSNPKWDSKPRETKVCYPSSTTWEVDLKNPLAASDKIIVKEHHDDRGRRCGDHDHDDEEDDDHDDDTCSGIADPNNPPIAKNQSVEVIEDTPKSIVLVGTDEDGDALKYSIVSSPTHGSLSGTAPNITYTPNLNYNGSDSFTFKVSDKNCSSDGTGKVTINVTPVNDAPKANNNSVTLLEDVAKAITLTGSDVDGNSLTYVITEAPTHGTLTGTSPNVTYTPALNYNGSDTFKFKVNDGTTDSNVATVSLTITPVSDPPIANNQSVIVEEDVAKLITLTGSDPDGNTLTYTIVSSPSHGTLSGSGSNITFTPTLNYSGSDSFTFKVKDGTNYSSPAIVSITITSVNDAPKANNNSVTVVEDVAKAITLTGSDIDEDQLTYIITEAPTHGTLTGTSPNVIYTPALNYNGSDTFKFKVNDGTTDSNIATVSITITPVSDPPVANNQSVTVEEDVAKSITLTGSDPDGNTLTYTIVSSPSHGTLSGTGSNITFTPNLNYSGSDSFTFKVKDETTFSSPATVSITITPVNDAPIADNKSVTVKEDIAKEITLTGNDIDENALTFELITGPTHGTLSGTTPNVIYTPSLNFNGSDSFTFKANDGAISSAVATVSITVTPENDSPVATAQNISVVEDSEKSITLTGSDIDGNALTFAAVSAPTHGVLSGTAPNLTYTPSLNYSGLDSFTFKANDGALESTPETISITITPINDAPMAIADNESTQEDVAKSITLTGNDLDGDPITFTIASAPAHGTLSGAAPNVTYTPNINYNGSDSFTFRTHDGTVNSDVATVSLTVTPINDAPAITSPFGALVTKEDSLLQICINVVDVDGDSNFIFEQPVNSKGEGTMIFKNTPAGFCYLFTPPSNYNGESIWDITVHDPGGLTGSGSVKFTIIPVNDPPKAMPDSITVKGKSSIVYNVIANDAAIAPPASEFYDIYSGLVDALRLDNIISGPYNGTATKEADGNIKYTPNYNYSGVDSLRYRVCDSGNPSLCDSGLVIIEVGAPDFAIYEAVSPNGDGLNDYWRIDGVEAEPYSKNLVRVFDRYNNLVFETKNYSNENNAWKGESNHGLSTGALPEGTYFYSILLSDGQLFSGYVFLKRN